MAETRALDGVILTVDGQPLAPELYPCLRRVRVEESVLLPDAFSLAFDDPHFELFDRDLFTVGTRVDIAFRADGGPVLVTAGEATAISVEQGASGRHDLVVTGLDLTHRLAREAKVRTYQRMTDGDIAARIAGEYGLQTDVDGTRTTHEHVVQSHESDYAFLRRRAAGIGYDFWITERTFHFKKRPSADGSPPVLRWGENLTRFSVRFSCAERCDEVRVRSWDPLAKTVVEGSATEGDAGTTAPAAHELADAARTAFGRVTRSTGHFPVGDSVEADALAASLLLRASGSEVVLRGEARGDPLVGAGAQIRLDRVGARLGGDYRVTSVEHVYGPGTPYLTRFVCGGKEPAGLADLVGVSGGGMSTPSRGAPHIGLVTNNDDPDQLGRVKVSYPTLSAQEESDWARVVSAGAGAGRGAHWTPEVGDEVVVAFELDDPARPLVLGGLWSRKGKPPEPATVSGGVVRSRVLASRTDQRLTLIDDPDPAVELALGDGSCRVYLASADSSLRGDKKLVISAKEVEVRASGTLRLAGQKIEISADDTVAVKGRRIELN